MRFTLRSILLATLVVAAICAPLAKPSVWWALLLPAIGTLLSAFFVTRVVDGPDRARTFWTSCLIGVFVYLMLVVYVGIFSGLSDWRGDSKIWDDYLGRPLFKLLHGESVFITNRQGMRDADFQSFLLWIHVPFAVAAAMISSSAALWFTRGK